MTRDEAMHALQASVGGCREEVEHGDRCFAPAEYVLWGKLFPAEALGPRCYDHAARHVHYSALRPGTTYALIHLGDVACALAAASAPESFHSREGRTAVDGVAPRAAT